MIKACPGHHSCLPCAMGNGRMEVSPIGWQVAPASATSGPARVRPPLRLGSVHGRMRSTHIPVDRGRGGGRDWYRG